MRIVPLKEGEDASKALDNGRLAVEEHTVGRRSLRFPSDVCSLRSGAYAVQVLAHDKRNAEIAISRPGLMYVEPDNLPVSLSDLLCCNDILAEKWRVAYGTPSIQPNAAGALPKTSTLITLKGNFESGDAVWNGPNSGFEHDKLYAIRLSARLLPKDAKYVRL